jgi:hypothetical protein
MPNPRDSYARTARAKSGARTHKPRKSKHGVQRNANLKSPDLDVELLEKVISQVTQLYSATARQRKTLETVAANPTHDAVQLMLENDVPNIDALRGVRDQSAVLRMALKQIKHRKIIAQQAIRDAGRQASKEKQQPVRRPATSMA